MKEEDMEIDNNEASYASKKRKNSVIVDLQNKKRKHNDEETLLTSSATQEENITKLTNQMQRMVIVLPFTGQKFEYYKKVIQ